MSDHPQIETIERQLLAYLKAHPAAADTAEGIGKWWMTEPPDAQTLESALDRLVERGILERAPGPDRQLRYRKAKRVG